jgi:hypothetical protein
MDYPEGLKRERKGPLNKSTGRGESLGTCREQRDTRIEDVS